jgi:hypothetical protein
MCLKNLTQGEADRIERLLNHRFLKCPDFLTPNDVFNETRDMLSIARREYVAGRLAASHSRNWRAT